MKEKFKFNLLRDLFKTLPKGNIEIIPDDPKDQHIADQYNLIIKRHNEVNDGMD